MKYISEESIIRSWVSLIELGIDRKCQMNKFFGLLEILKHLNIQNGSGVKPGEQYMLTSGLLSNNLQGKYYFGQDVKEFGSQEKYYALFPDCWSQNTLEGLLKGKKVSLIDVATICMQDQELQDEIDQDAFLSRFLNDYHLGNASDNLFLKDAGRTLEFQDARPDRKRIFKNIKSHFKVDGGAKNTLAFQRDPIQANPGEISRGPFIQPLYSAQENLKCILLTNFDFMNNYKVTSGSEIVESLKADTRNLNVILYGPPGTGKTYNAMRLAVELINKADTQPSTWKDIKDLYDSYVNSGRIEFVTFHQSYSYEEFVEGLKPVVKEGLLEYEIVDGIFKRICEKAKQDLAITSDGKYDPSNSDSYVLIVDEINRGNISKIFGELITLIESTKRAGASEEIHAKLAYSGANSRELFSVPSNVYILGTMNSTDRSIAILDTALRRRFEFFECEPDHKLLETNIDGIDLQRLLEKINTRIEYLLDKDHKIGHSYFLNVKSKNELCSVFRNMVLPLLEEYFYGDYEKIKLILADNDESNKPSYLRIIKDNKSLSQEQCFGVSVDGIQSKQLYAVNEDLHSENYDSISPDVFISIYEKVGV